MSQGIDLKRLVYPHAYSNGIDTVDMLLPEQHNFYIREAERNQLCESELRRYYVKFKAKEIAMDSINVQVNSIMSKYTKALNTNTAIKASLGFEIQTLNKVIKNKEAECESCYRDLELALGKSTWEEFLDYGWSIFKPKFLIPGLAAVLGVVYGPVLIEKIF